MTTKSKKVVLALSAHPADAFDLAGGALALHRKAGDRVVILSLTAGGRSHAPGIYGGDVQAALTEETEANLLLQTLQTKKKELQNACKVIDAETICLDYTDEPLVSSQDLIYEIARHYRKIRPDILLTHHQAEIGHHDHPVAGLISLRALTVAARWLKGSPLPPHLIPFVYFYGNQFRASSVRWHAALPLPSTHVVNIQSVIEEKTRMLQAFETQAYGGMNYTSKEYADRRFKAIEGAAGLLNGLQYAEEFVALYPNRVELL